jgi:isoleucyl-tRNA synthetase
VKEEYFDEDIERQVRRMQTVIELARNIREKHNSSLKVGLHVVFPSILADNPSVDRRR